MNATARKKLRLALLLLPLCAALALCYLVGLRYEQSRSPAAPSLPLSEEAASSTLSHLTATRADRETEVTEALWVRLAEDDAECRITEGGTYRLTGKTEAGIVIDAQEQTVRLVLDSVTVCPREGPALYVASAGKVILTLPEGSKSTLSDTGHYPAGSPAEACLHSNADLTVNGNGSLTVNGLYLDGIRSKNVLRVLGGQITVKCKRTALHGGNGLWVEDGTLNISSEKYGLRTTKTGRDGRGALVVCGGELRVIAGRHAFLTGRGDLYIWNCVVHDRSVVSTWNVGGEIFVQGGCILP